MDAPGPKATLEELKNIMRFWLGMGCDGFRVDMAGFLIKHDENGKGTIKLWQNVRGFLDKEFPQWFLNGASQINLCRAAFTWIFFCTLDHLITTICSDVKIHFLQLK